MGVAEEMKKKYGKKLELKIYTTDSEEARPYNFKSSTNVLFQKEPIPNRYRYRSEKNGCFSFPKAMK